MTTAREATQYLRDAKEILGPHASAPEVILAADFIRRGYLDRESAEAVALIGVERAKNSTPDEGAEASEVVTGTPTSPEFGFAPAPDPVEHTLERWDRR